MKTKVFNLFVASVSKHAVPVEKAVLEFINKPVLIDDVDTTITSFLKTYGAPVHIDPDDFEDGDDKDFDEFDDADDTDVSMSVEPAPAEPAPAEPAPAEPVPAEPASAESVSE